MSTISMVCDAAVQAAEDSPPASPHKFSGDAAAIFQGFTYVEPSLLGAVEMTDPRAAD